MTSLLEKLKAGKRNIKTIVFPGTDEKVGITVLTEGQVQAAHFATERVFSENGIEFSPSTVDAYKSENNTQVLFRALVDPAKKSKDGDYEPYFPDVDEFRDLLRAAAKDILIEAYNAFEDECNPSPMDLSEERLNEILEDVKKNPTHGNDLSFRTLLSLVIYSANRPVTAPKVNGSISSE